MANIMTPSLMPGERSLPAELRTQRGSNFAQRRLAMGLQPSADPTTWGRLRGLRGLGQTCIDSIDNADGTTTCLEYSSGTTPDPLSSGSFNSIPTTTPTPDISCDAVSIASMTAQQMYNCGYTSTVGGAITNPPLNTSITPAQAGLTAAQQAQLIAAVGNSTVSLIRTAAGGPYTVAGTNLVYNPATGALTTETGVGTTATNVLATLTSNPLLLIGGVALVAFMLLGNRGK